DSQIDIGMRPSELFDMLASALKIANGIDYDRPGGLMLLRSENEKSTKRIIDENFISNLVAAVAMSDLDTMAANFGLEKGKLQPGKVTQVDGGAAKSIVAREKHLYLATNERPLKRILKSSPNSAKLTPKQTKSQNQADILVHLGV